MTRRTDVGAGPRVSFLNEAEPSRGTRWVLPFSVAALGSVGAFKGLPLVAALPFDLTALVATITFLALVSQWRNAASAGAISAVLWLWLFLTPGLIVAFAVGAPLNKSLQLYTVTLLCALAGTVISNQSMRIWIGAQLALALLMALLTLIAPDASTQTLYGRTIVEGGSPITTGRVIGLGVVICALLILHQGRFRLGWALILATLLGLLGVSLLLVGSRGPVVAAAIAILIGAVIGQKRLLQRTALGVLVAGATYFAYSSAIGESSNAVDRAISGFSTPSDPARQWLLSVAWEGIQENPMGIGWGGFAALSDARGSLNAYPHNLPLEIILENGWGGSLAIMIWGLIVVVKLASRPRHGFDSFVIPLGTYWLLNALGSSDINGNRELWIVVGVATALAFRPDKRLRSIEDGTAAQIGDTWSGLPAGPRKGRRFSRSAGM